MQNVNSNISALNANDLNNVNNIKRMNSLKTHNRYFLIEKNLSILPILLTIFGTLGNMIAFYVLTRKKLRVQSTMLYFASLTLMDTLSLYQWNFNFFYKYQINENAENLENQSIFLCRYISFMANFSVQSSAWILAMITIDRYLIVTNTKWKQKISKNIKYNLLIITSIICFFALTNLPITFLNGQITTHKNKTRVECYNTNFYKIWQKVIVLIDCVSPLTLMITFNCLLIYKTYKSSVKLNSSQHVSRQRKSEFLQASYSCADLTNQNEQHSPKLGHNFYFEPFASLKQSKSKNLYEHYCSFTVIPDEKINQKLNSVPNSPILNPKARRYSDICQDNISPKSHFLTTETTTTTTNKNSNALIRSNNNLAIASECNLSRSMVSLAERPNTSHVRNRKIVLMLTLLTLSFMISTLPSSIFYAFFRTSLNDKPYRRLLSLIFNCLRHLSHAFNFIIYFTSSSIIKQQLKEIIRDLKRKKLINVLKENFSCILITNNKTNKTSGDTIRKTNSPDEDSSALNNSKSIRVSEKENNNDFIEFKITKLNDLNLGNSFNSNEKISLKNEHIFTSSQEDEKKSNDNQVEFETISFKVPVIKKFNRP